jgi:hypothetical protein
MQLPSIGILKTIRSVLAMIVVAALALYVYDYYKRSDRQHARDEAAVIREQTHALQMRAAEMNRRLQQVGEQAQALQAEVASQRAAVEQDRSQQLVAQFLIEGLQVAQSLRVAVAESYQTNLQWPTSNADIGMPPPAQLQGQSLQSASVGDQGVVTLHYDAKTGVVGGMIRLIPQAAPSGVTWRCETSSYPDIAVLVPQCRFVH